MNRERSRKSSANGSADTKQVIDKRSEMTDLAIAIFGVGVLAFVAFLYWLTHSTAPF